MYVWLYAFLCEDIYDSIIHCGKNLEANLMSISDGIVE